MADGRGKYDYSDDGVKPAKTGLLSAASLDDDVVEEDKVEFEGRASDLKIATSVPAPSQCPHCDRRLKVDSCQQSVAVQTESHKAEKFKGVRPNVKGDQVPVSKEQLAAIHRYYVAVKNAYFNYALTDGDANEVIQRLFEQTPEMLSSSNQHGLSPIEAALVQHKWQAGAQLLTLAERKNPRALRHRTASAQDALMLAVAGGSEATVRQLLSQRCGSYACVHYDAKGQNSFHVCALGASVEILQLLLAELGDLLSKGELQIDCATSAFCTCDCEGSTPLHYMARENQADMLQAVHAFAQTYRLRIDWDARQASGSNSRRLTPLVMAAESGALRACEFLLQSGLAGIDLHEHLDLWLQARLGEPARDLLAQQCQLLQPISALPPGTLDRLQTGLQESHLMDEFMLRLRSHWPRLPQLRTVSTLLTLARAFSPSCRLVVWSILNDLGTESLARLLEA